MYILGINSAYHESSACLIKDGKMIGAAEEERFNRIKHGKPSKVDNADELPLDSIEFCLNEVAKLEGRKIGLEDIAHISYSLNPEERLERNTTHRHPYQVTPDDFGTLEGERVFYEKNIEVEAKLRKAGFRGDFHYLNHHDCHAASSFFVSPYGEAAVMVVDGIGEYESTSLYKGTGNRLRRIATLDYPNSLGFLWEKISKFLGFSEYDASKVMGLASYGNPSINMEPFRGLISFDENGIFVVDDSLIRFRNDDYSGLEELFSLERRKKVIKDVEAQTQRYADVAATLQTLTEDIIISLANSLKQKTGSKYLCLAGGVALNCVANGRLIQEGIFDDVFIQPAANDAGTAIGATYYIWNQILGKERVYVFESPYLGPDFSDDEIRSNLDKRGVRYRQYDDLEGVTAKLISEGNVVSWFQGRMELGPRALGNRSILADPRKKEIVAALNHKVKHREPFRPFCPSILEEEVADWFCVGEGVANPCKYMLAAYDVLPHRKEVIPAVIHIDGTSRIQAVSRDLNPRFYHLIEAFADITGVPIILNTSFNDQEPIVCSPEEAIKTFLITDIDYLVIGDFIVSKADNKIPDGIPDIPLEQYFEKLR